MIVLTKIESAVLECPFFSSAQRCMSQILTFQSSYLFPKESNQVILLNSQRHSDDPERLGSPGKKSFIFCLFFLNQVILDSPNPLRSWRLILQRFILCPQLGSDVICRSSAEVLSLRKFTVWNGNCRVKTVPAKSACKMHSVFPAGSKERWCGALDFVQELAFFLQQMP